MTERKYKERCLSLFAKAREKCATLIFNPSDYDYNHLLCYWLPGGAFATIKKDNTSIELSIRGEMRAYLINKDYDVIAFCKDKVGAGSFYDEFSHYIRSDNALKDLLDEGLLWFDNNNWIEYAGITPNGDIIDPYCYFDNVLDADHILAAIEEVLDAIDEIINNIEETREFEK